jgi:uncharacterized membrane protein
MDIIRILLNSFIYFGIGYAALNNEKYSELLGLFTLGNAIVHFVFSVIVFRNKLLDRRLFFLLIAMVLGFITIAVPVQLEGNWVTLIWAVEALLLFSIGRFKSVRFYEWLGYIMIVFAMGSLLQDWSECYYLPDYDQMLFKFWTPVFNIYFATSLLVTVCLAGIVYIHHKKGLPEDGKKFSVYLIAEYLLPALLFMFTYLTFSNEISAYFDARFQQEVIHMPLQDDIFDYGLLELKGAAQWIYTLFFFIVLNILVLKKWSFPVIRWTTFGLTLLVCILFIFGGLNRLADLRDQYLNDANSVLFRTGGVYLWLRYVCFVLFGAMLFLQRQVLRTDTFSKFSIGRVYSGCLIHFFILVILSNELVNLNHLKYYNDDESYYSHTKTVYKLGFTILWSIYSLLLIAWGIFRKNKIARISAIAFFAFTLIKLVTFDTWDLSTGYKVVAYILLGAVLLLVAFLYQKFKLLIFGEE